MTQHTRRRAVAPIPRPCPPLDRPIAVAVLAAASLLLAACSRSEHVEVVDDFPSPVVEPLPLTMGLYLGDGLLEYSYEESLADSADWTFSLGAAQPSLFQPLLAGMFDEVVEVPELADGNANGVQAILEPRLEAFEFDIPSGQHSPFAEVWLEYSLHLYTPAGESIAGWRISGYGKSPATGSRPTDALEEATIRAMREAGANISLRFRTQPAVSDWLEGIRDADTTVGTVERDQ